MLRYILLTENPSIGLYIYEHIDGMRGWYITGSGEYMKCDPYEEFHYLVEECI